MYVVTMAIIPARNSVCCGHCFEIYDFITEQILFISCVWAITLLSETSSVDTLYKFEGIPVGIPTLINRCCFAALFCLKKIDLNCQIIIHFHKMFMRLSYLSLISQKSRFIRNCCQKPVNEDTDLRDSRRSALASAIMCIALCIPVHSFVDDKTAKSL